MSPWELLGAIGAVAYLIAGVWLAVAFIAWLLVAGGNRRRTPAPPAGPRARVVRSRDRAGVVEILPGFGDAENAREWGQG